MLYQIIYTCALTPGIDQDEIRSIAQKAQVSNAAIGVTGVLLAHQGSVLQVLEGDKDAVEGVMTKIRKDKRVTQVLIMLSRPSPKREFPNWSMGFKDVSASEDDTVLFKLTESSLRQVMPDTLSTEIQTFGKTFARVNGLASA